MKNSLMGMQSGEVYQTRTQELNEALGYLKHIYDHGEDFRVRKEVREFFLRVNGLDLDKD